MSGKDKFSDIEQLIAEFQASGLRELHARKGDLEIYLSNDADAVGLDGAPAASVARGQHAAAKAPEARSASQPTAASAVQAPTAQLDLPDGAVVIRAPYLGTFYRSPKPGAKAYVELGQQVTPDSDMCLVEVMKLFTAVRADCAGTVHAILASDGEMVVADQPLFIVIPA